MSRVKKDDQLHFLALDKESLPDHDLTGILSYYLPAELTHQQYPNLIDEGTSVATVANRALLVAYASPENSDRYRKLTKFVQEFFGKIDQFHTAARHPKWSEINLSAEIPVGRGSNLRQIGLHPIKSLPPSKRQAAGWWPPNNPLPS